MAGAGFSMLGWRKALIFDGWRDMQGLCGVLRGKFDILGVGVLNIFKNFSMLWQ